MTDPLDRQPTILVVEDDPANRSLLSALLKRAGYAVVLAEDGAKGLDLARRGVADAVLLDVGLPGIDGLEVCQRLRDDQATVTLPIIMLTGRTSTEDLVRGLDAGADDFLSKPFVAPELLARIRSSLRLRRAIAEMEAAHGVVAALANAVEAKDVTTENHCQRLAGLAYQVGEAVGLEGLDLKGVVFGALLHDVGKIGISEAVLTKPGPLTEPEWDEMRRHPIIGEQICRPLTSSRLFAPIVRHHHERWDGTGYPDRLRREEIPLGARIVTVVDSFDAMVHVRPYRAAMDIEEATAELRRHAGRQFDPELVDPFLAGLEDLAGSAGPGSLPGGAVVALAS